LSSPTDHSVVPGSGKKRRSRGPWSGWRRSSSKPDRGLVRLEQEALNQRGEVVARWVGWNIYRARPAS